MDSNGYSMNTGFYNIGSALSESAGCPAWLTPAGRSKYDTAWIGKWHLSNVQTSGAPEDGLISQYGFTNLKSIPDAPAGIASPAGWVNEGTEGGPITTTKFGAENYLSDQSVSSRFETWAADKASTGQTPWFCGVSFVNPHDIAFGPYCFGLTSGDFQPPALAGPGFHQGPVEYAAPPVGGDPTKDIPAQSSYNIFTASALPKDAGLGTWNGDDSLAYTAYASSGKPDLQLTFRQLVYKLDGRVVPKFTDATKWQNGWNTFLNYYYWMHACADIQVGRVLTSLSAGGRTLGNNTVILFLSDHGEYGGSHALAGKGGAVYDESIHVPLYISYPSQRTTQTQVKYRSQMVSSVDLLPFILTLACGSPTYWSQTGKPFTYLGGRESVYDFLFTATPTLRRTVTVGGTTLQYILHTYDEGSAQGGTALDLTYSAATPPPPGHIICMRTQTKDSAGNYAGAKIAKYSFWQCGTTLPDTAQPQQYEFYDYLAASGSGPGNLNELGNDYFTSTRYSAFKTAFDGVLSGTELYGALPGTLSTVQAQARTLYLSIYGSGC
ncbi:MAG: sulfatase-like hydrolase/transferase [Bryobacteraceae bacterium]